MTEIIFYHCRENRWSVNALAAALEKAGIAGLKMRFPATAEEFLREAAAAGPGAAAAVSFFTSQKAAAGELARRLRGRGPLLLAGGPHASARPQETLEMGFDCVVTGEGEEVLPEILRALAGGERPAGIFRAARIKNLAPFPSFCARLGLPGPIEITRGCPFACAYCQTSFLSGVKPRHRPVASVLAHMRELFAAGIKDVRFITPDAFAYGSPDGRALNLPALRELLTQAGAEADKAGGKIFFGSFPSEVRPEHIVPEALELTRRHASNRRLVIGAQTGSPRLLKAIGRGHTAGDILRACDLCRKHRFTPYLDFIFGLPGETREDEKHTEALIEELSARGAMIHTHAFMPLPGTPLADNPGPGITRTAEAFLKKMEARGKAFGKWRVQRRPDRGS
ncbi:MAG: TIGR04013 family B12-binding domain/radical SAM domain-containing protein [Elusimicrobiales bacterium]|nr:TIGR04013 family B12-binding domain/radical SAM domain-containing protein [Elusimicrobiales bacterium]